MVNWARNSVQGKFNLVFVHERRGRRVHRAGLEWRQLKAAQAEREPVLHKLTVSLDEV